MTGHSPSVLVVAYDFPPHGAIGTMRTLRVVRELDARGWKVTVLTGDPDSFLPGTPVEPHLLDSVPATVRVVRAGAVRPWQRVQNAVLAPLRATPPRPSAGAAAASPSHGARPVGRSGVLGLAARAKDVVDAALAIPDRESGWLAPAIGRGLIDQLRQGRPDVIYSSAPPWTGQLVAAGLHAALRRPWVADFRDPWARAPWRGDRYDFALGAAARLEGRVVRRADRIVFVAAANRDDFAATYGQGLAAKFAVVPNGCDPTEFDALRGVTPVADGPAILLHAGSLYAGRTPLPLFRGIAKALSDGRLDAAQFRLRFLGANVLKGVDLAAACRDLGIAHVVEFLPRVPRQQGLREMLSASALLLLQPGHTVSVPGKVYEYLAANRPILSIAEEGETAEVVRSSGVGVSVTPDDDSAIADALVQVLAMTRTALAPPPPALYDGRVGAGRIADLLATFVPAHAAGSNATRAEAKL